MKHLIMGTAGHVDHGKTSLIKALTGVDCDTHKEEKKRGITINLGFSNLELSEKESIGIVDVPGHADFVHTMVGGASGIDFVMLVISADSGVMPQTIEHLNIMKVLGVKRGLIALNKADLLEPELLDITREEISDFVKGTFLEGAPIVPVSAVTGDGISELKASIKHIYDSVEPRDHGEVFRLFIDRIFTVSGFGTVVTGSVISGALSKGDNAYLLPGEKELRVRRLERHGQEVDKVVAGDRASINLVGLERSDFKRGMIISDRVLNSTNMLDAHLTLFDDSKEFELWNQVEFHLGTYEAQARIHLINKDKLKPGEDALIQIKLSRPLVASIDDNFVIRSTSSDKTLGGGRIIDAQPLHHRRRTKKLIDSMTRIASGELADLIGIQLAKSMDALSSKELASILNVSGDEIEKVMISGIGEKVLVFGSEDNHVAVQKSLVEHVQSRIITSIAGYHKRSSFDEKGMTIEELMSNLSIEKDSSFYVVLENLLNELVNSEKIKKVQNTWASSEHKVDISPQMKKDISFIENYLKNSGMQVPLMSELVPACKRQRIDEKQINKILHYLVRSNKAYKIEEHYMHAVIVDGCRQKLVEHLKKESDGVTVAKFRDLVSGNRKICLLLIGQYDEEGTTVRDGNVRRLA